MEWEQQMELFITKIVEIIPEGFRPQNIKIKYLKQKIR